MTTNERQTVYEMVSERLAEAIEAGNVPWQKPWQCVGGTGRRASNLISKKPYRGINVFLTALTPFSSPWWVTFKQAQSLGGSVRKGEKGTMVVYWQILRKSEKNAAGDKVEKKIPLLKKYYIFNVEQCDGIPANKIPQDVVVAPVSVIEAVAEAEALVAGYVNGPRISFGGDVAAYSPVMDSVRVPVRDSFVGAAEYYNTFFHELVHSTGHKSRLGRLESTTFGSEPYAREELVAEMGACFLTAVAGLEVTYDNSAAYLRNWARSLRMDPKMAISAASQAQKASDLILGATDDSALEDETEAAA